MFLNRYVDFYFREYQSYSIEEYGFKTFVVILIFLSFLFKLLPRRYWLAVPLVIVGIYSYFKNRGNRSYGIVDGGKTLVIKNSCKYPPLVDCLGIVILRSLGLDQDPTFKEVKKLGCEMLNNSYWKVRIQLYSPHPRFPRRQILLNNHTHSPIKDSFSFFPFIPKDSKIIVVQQRFSEFTNYVANKCWGAYIIDKDDKTQTGRDRMNNQIQKLVDIMNRESDLTVVIYPQGRVPKSPEDCREPKTFYPGAFYISLLTGYWVTPMITDCSNNGTFTTIVKEPIDLLTEYRERVDFSSRLVREFREIPGNRELLNEICERFKNLYKSEYDIITKIESQDG